MQDNSKRQILSDIRIVLTVRLYLARNRECWLLLLRLMRLRPRRQVDIISHTQEREHG